MECKICGHHNINTFKVKEMMFGFDEVFDYFQCSKCKCLQINKIPKDMSKYYPTEFYSYKKLENSKWIKKILRKHRDRHVLTGNGILGLILSKLYLSHHIDLVMKANVSMESTILDVGCGNGSILKLLGDAGFKNLVGVDPFISEDIKYENGVKILKGYIHDIDGEFDLIMFNSSFEHIPNPKETLEVVSRLLPNNGTCVMRIPTVSSYAWEYYGVNWVQLDAPRHFFLYSMESIKFLTSKYGLSLKNCVYDSTEFQFWGSEQYLNGIPLTSRKSYGVNPKNSIFSKKKIGEFRKNAKNLNDNKLGDRVTLYFIKE